MARINNNYTNLDNETRAVVGPLLKRLGLSLPLKNPFHNILAQAIEVIEALNRASWIINNGIGSGDASPLIIKEGRGVSAVEAPRGTLFHEYVIDNMGIVKKCNIITPTAQNLNMIEADIALRVNALLEKKASKETIVSEVEKLIRAYDPCFSCSTHFLRVDWDVE